MVRFMSAGEAANLINNGSKITISSSGGLGCPDAMLKAMGERFKKEGMPHSLTTLHPIAAGDMYGIKGIDYLAELGMLSKIIAGSYPSGPSSLSMPAIWQLITENRIPAYNVPSGIMFDMHREAAAKRPGVLTKVGMNTFVDPEIEGCAMNERAKAEPIVEKIVFQNEKWLYFPAIVPDIAIIRASSADENGNLSFEHEGAYLGALEQALTVHNNKGLVIAQVKRSVAAGSIDCRKVHIPKTLVDVVILDEEQLQTTQTPYDPAISGEIKKPLSSFTSQEFGLEKVVARRAALNFKKGDAAVLGFGIASNVPGILLEEKQHGKVTWLIEQGAVGGMPLTGFKFGCSVNPDAIIPSPYQFTYFQAGGADIALLSFLQIDKEGNVNVSKLAGKPYLTAGVGGFMDITARTQRILFCGLFTAGARIKIEDQQVKIEKEGIRKLVDQVEQVTFCGKEALRKGQEIFYVTERCVMRLTSEGLLLEEVAAGVNLERDILAMCDFDLKVAENLKIMDPRIFADTRMALEID